MDSGPKGKQRKDPQQQREDQTRRCQHRKHQAIQRCEHRRDEETTTWMRTSSAATTGLETREPRVRVEAKSDEPKMTMRTQTEQRTEVLRRIYHKTSRTW